MNTVYVLIMIIAGGNAAAIHTQEFSTLAYCEMAKDTFESNKPEYSWRMYSADCVKK